MNKILLTGLIISVLFISCSKDDNGGGSGDSNQYMSLTAGNSWKYETINAGNTDTFDLTASSRDTFIQARSFRIFDNSNGNNEYYSIVGPEYYTWTNFSDSPAISLTNKYLVDNAPLGTEWQAATTTFPIDVGLPTGPLTATVIINSKITAVDTTMTVNGRTYSNVIGVTSSLSITGLPISIPVTSDIRAYYAKKYGSIYQITQVSAQGSSIADVETRLLSANF